MPLALNAQTAINIVLDKGMILVPSLGPLTVQSKGVISGGEISTQDDIENFLKQKINNLPYIQGAFLLGGMVSFNQISKIPLSKKFFKKGKEVVLAGDIECAITVVPAKNDKAVPDASPPTKLTITLSPVQQKLLSA